MKLSTRAFLRCLGSTAFLATLPGWARTTAAAAEASEGADSTVSSDASKAARPASPLRAGRLPEWTLWTNFARGIVTAEGRVVDRSDARLITTSEGQSYAMFFALVNDDRALFERLWQWTVDNLCQGDATRNLPAWLWGRSETVDEKTKTSTLLWGVLDTNNATDADLWLAYDLLEAARLWNRPDYREAGLALLTLVRETCIREVGSLGPVCLPGRVGFVRDDGAVTVNPSYCPLQLFTRFALEDPYWRAVERSTVRMLLRAAPGGIAPDWATFSARGLRLDAGRNEGSWDAVRTYMWIGMLSEDVPERSVLMRHFAPFYAVVTTRKAVPGRADAAAVTVGDPGPDAFQAAFLSWYPESVDAAHARAVLQQHPVTADQYYRSMLVLFGLGFDARRFAFDREGRLVRPIRGTEF